MYVQLGVYGLRRLQNYNVESGKWDQAHIRAHFVLLKCLLTDGKGVMSVTCNASQSHFTVHVDRSRVTTDSKAALGRMLLRLHMYRCTADVASCRDYYENKRLGPK